MKSNPKENIILKIRECRRCKSAWSTKKEISRKDIRKAIGDIVEK